MKQTYFSLKFLRLLYRECNLFDRLELENELLENDDLSAEYQDLKKSFQSLPKVLFSPKESTLEKVKSYARFHI